MANEKQNGPSQQNLQTAYEDLKSAFDKQANEMAELRALLMATVRSQPAVSPDTVWAREHEKEMRIKAELESLAVQFQESCQMRTQYQANKLNPDAKRLYKVSVSWCPEIVIRANDAITARAYYDKLCGILAVNPIRGKASNEYQIVDVTDDAGAKALVQKHWQPPQSAAA